MTAKHASDEDDSVRPSILDDSDGYQTSSLVRTSLAHTGIDKYTPVENDVDMDIPVELKIRLMKTKNQLPPQEQLGDDVGEAELVGTYLDPIFHNPENNRQFRWLSTGAEDTESQRPDGNIFQLEQRRVQFSTGCVEVKPDKTRAQTRKIHEDTLRLVNFCKDTIDKQNAESMISVQVFNIMFLFTSSLLKPMDYI